MMALVGASIRMPARLRSRSGSITSPLRMRPRGWRERALFPIEHPLRALEALTSFR
jgi:hypothetical protein